MDYLLSYAPIKGEQIVVFFTGSYAIIFGLLIETDLSKFKKENESNPLD